jgi:hypothetical protein
VLAASVATAALAFAPAGHSTIPLRYYQGVATDPAGRLYFDGVFTGLYRADAMLRQQAGVDDVIPPAVTAAEGYNHIGDITWDRREHGRVLLALECYTPGAPNAGNTCGHGGFGVADPGTLAWRYRVPLDPAEIAKAMWAEVSPDGRLVWTSAGNDLLAYRADQIRPGAGPLRSVKRLPGAVPPTGITGAAFYGDALLLAGQSGGHFEVWQLDVRTGARRRDIQLDLSGESEGLAVTPRDGELHWIVTPIDPLGRPPTFPGDGNVLLNFRSARARPALHARAIRRGATVTVSVRGPHGPIAGATVRAGTAAALTSGRGTAHLKTAAHRVAVYRADLRGGRVTIHRPAAPRPGLGCGVAQDPRSACS